MTINVQNIIDILETRIATADSDLSSVELNRLIKASNIISNLKGSATYTATAELPEATEYNQGRILWNAETQNYVVNSLGTWENIVLSSTAFDEFFRSIYADSNYSAQGWAVGTDFSDATGDFIYSYLSGIQQSSGGARTTALEEITGYFEILISSTPSQGLIGLARDSSPGGYNNVPSIYLNDGGGYGGVTGGTNLGGFGAGDTLQIAYNANANRVWFGKNNTYYAATNTTGALIPGTGNLRCIIMAGSTGGASQQGTFRDRADFVYSPPSGFTVTY